MVDVRDRFYIAERVKNNRRTFIKGLATTALGAGLSRSADPPESLSKQEELLNLLVADGYNPSGGNCALLAVIADAHIFLGSEYPQYRTETYSDELIAEINSLDTLVTELVMAGDLIAYHSMSPGTPPWGTHRTWALEEFPVAKAQMERFNYRTWIVPGNHDTNAYETNAELFREQMNLPVAYQKATLGGVPVFFLNSGNGGMIDPIQEAWFRHEASFVAKDQEVLIVAHIPPFFSRWIQAGHKRIITDVFKNHEATVWVMSGHNHSFSEQKFVLEGVTYIQTQVTAASTLAPQLFGDRRNPGYAVLALQDGKLVSRVFRSLLDVGYQTRPAISQMSSGAVQFLFDDVLYPAATYEEGFYNHDNLVIDFSGVHVGSYIVYCKKITIRVEPDRYLGQVSEFIIAGSIKTTNVPLCHISSDGEDGTWLPLDFPAVKGSGLYTVEIPEAFRGNLFFIQLDTGLTLSVHGFSMSGWALAANESLLTGYERWLIRHYKTLEKNETTHPESISPGTDHTNIVNFGFNLMPVDQHEISGLPTVSIVAGSNPTDQYYCIKFTRISALANPGIDYEIEVTHDMKQWNAVPLAELEETILSTDNTWEEVEFKILHPLVAQSFYRVRLNHPATWPE